MSSKKRHGAAGRRSTGGTVVASSPSRPALFADGQARLVLLVAVLVLAAAVVIGADLIFGAISNGSGSTAATATPAATSSQIGVVVQGRGGHWTNVTPDQLAQMMARKDFTLVNVKTPYIGEIDGTDLYIPYDQLTARASALPSNKGARILVYCRSGAESAQAAQTLLDLGYTNVWNLDGGMNAWQASGRPIVTRNR
ncbi:MAG: rhodanese-like domain-containing protein [Candidatus Limnocylindrales bacterium]|jgi:rhodanese-related sulfurtransferase